MFALAVFASLLVSSVFALDRYVYSFPGETVYTLALRTGSNVYDLQRANPSLLYPGNNRYGGMVRIPGSLFAAEDVDDKFKLSPETAHKLRLIKKRDHLRCFPRPELRTTFDAEDSEDKINWSTVTKIAGQVNRIGQILGYEAEDADDKIKINLDEIAKIAGQTQQIIQILKSDDELENGLGKKLKKLGKKVGRGVKKALPTVVDVAGKVSQIGQVLGYDAEDIDNGDVDAIIDVVCKIVNTVCKVTDTGVKVHDTVQKHKSADLIERLYFDAEDAEDKIKINPSKIVDIAGKINQIGKILGYDAEEVDDKFRLKINPKKITKIAGQVAQIGQILGYDAEDVDNCRYRPRIDHPPF